MNKLIIIFSMFASSIAHAEINKWDEFDDVHPLFNKIAVSSNNVDSTKIKEGFDKIKAAKKSDIPAFLAIGGMIRCQVYLGGCYGYQINIGKGPDGEWYVSKYRYYSALLGYAFAFKGELYVSACFGDCLDSHVAGWFLTVDGMGTIPLDGVVNAGVFAESGLDITDFVEGQDPYTVPVRPTIYVGASIDVGYGYGVSIGVYHYTQLWKVKLKDVDKLGWKALEL